MKDKELRKLIGSRAKQRRLELNLTQMCIRDSSYSYSLAIQYNVKLNLTSTRFVFSSMQNLLCTTDC